MELVKSLVEFFWFHRTHTRTQVKKAPAPRLSLIQTYSHSHLDYDSQAQSHCDSLLRMASDSYYQMEKGKPKDKGNVKANVN